MVIFYNKRLCARTCASAHAPSDADAGRPVEREGNDWTSRRHILIERQLWRKGRVADGGEGRVRRRKTRQGRCCEKAETTQRRRVLRNDSN